MTKIISTEKELKFLFSKSILSLIAVKSTTGSFFEFSLIIFSIFIKAVFVSNISLDIFFINSVFSLIFTLSSFLCVERGFKND